MPHPDQGRIFAGLNPGGNIARHLRTAAAISAAVSVFMLNLSPALASIALGLGVACAALYAGIVPGTMHRIPRYLWIIPVLYLCQCAGSALLSGLDPEDMRKLLLKLPLLFLPVLHPIFADRQKKPWEILSLALPFCWISLASVINYAANYKFLNQMVLESKPIPLYSGIYHIEFSVLLAGICLLSILALGRFRAKESFAGQLLLLVTFFNVISLHVLSARTGILGFWLALGIVYLLRHGRQVLNLRNLSVLSLLILGLVLIPSMRNRISNTWEDLGSLGSDADANNKSFAQRWIAWEVAVQAIGEKPLSGYGMGKVWEAMHAEYDKRPPGLRVENRKMPHNQFLDLGVQSGVFVMALFLAFFVAGIRRNYLDKNWGGMGFVILFAIACVFESMLERQAGVITFVVILASATGIDAINGVSTPSDEDGVLQS